MTCCISMRTLFRSGRSDWYMNRFRLAASITIARVPTSRNRFVSLERISKFIVRGRRDRLHDVARVELLIVAAPLLVAPLLFDLEDLDDHLALLSEEPLAFCDERVLCVAFTVCELENIDVRAQTAAASSPASTCRCCPCRTDQTASRVVRRLVVDSAHDERRRGPVLRRAFVDVVAAEEEEGFLHGAAAFEACEVDGALALVVREVGERRVLSHCFFEAVGEGRVVDGAVEKSEFRPRRLQRSHWRGGWSCSRGGA